MTNQAPKCPASPGGSPKTGRILSVFAWAGIAAFFIALTMRYAQAERFFYFWDNFAYHRATLESLGALQDPAASWFAHLRMSMQSGFSQLFTVTIAPLMAQFGEGRVVFITGIVGFYLLPCAALCTLVVHRLLPLTRGQAPLVFIASATLPVLWRASLTGYPDIGGIMVGLAGVWVITGDKGFLQWSSALSLGCILAVTFLFRRHLAYLIIPLMAATSALALFHSLEAGGRRPWGAVAGTLARLATTTLITVLIIWMVAPNYFQELVSTNFRELYLPFQFPIIDAWRQHRDYIGFAYGILGLAGLAWAMAKGNAPRWACILLLIYLVMSLYIWVFHLRYLSVQYNLHFAVIIAIGLGLLTAQLCRRFGNTAGAVAAAIMLLLWLDRLSFVRVIPAAAQAALPARLPPLANPDYEEIKRLVTFMRDHCQPPQNHVLVAASSQIINSDMLTVGEGALWGRNHRQIKIMNGSHADTVQPYPLRDMLITDWLLVVSPFQHHLRVEDQGVVLSTYQAMTSDSLYRRDFRKLDRGFSLSNGIIIEIHQRTGASNLATQVDTARRVFDTVGTKDSWTGPFMVGEADTGAEYYDARLIVPSGPGQYRADLEQVRLRDGQKSVRIFVRLDGSATTQLSGQVAGFAQIPVTLDTSFYPDPEGSAAPELSTQQQVPAGHDFRLKIASGRKGIVVLEFTPDTIPPAGTPLGLTVTELTLAAGK